MSYTTQNWWKITTKSATATYRIRKKATYNGIQDWVVAGQKVTLIKLRPDHAGDWWSNFRKEYSIKEAVPYRDEVKANTAPCGINVISDIPISSHTKSCKSCRRLLEKTTENSDVTSNPTFNTKKSKASSVETKVSVKGLTDLSLNGIINLMKDRQFQAQELANQYERAIKAVEEIESLDIMLKEIQDEVASHAQALNYFLNQEGKMNVFQKQEPEEG